MLHYFCSFILYKGEISVYTFTSTHWPLDVWRQVRTLTWHITHWPDIVNIFGRPWNRVLMISCDLISILYSLQNISPWTSHSTPIQETPLEFRHQTKHAKSWDSSLLSGKNRMILVSFVLSQYTRDTDDPHCTESVILEVYKWENGLRMACRSISISAMTTPASSNTRK